MLSFYDQKHLTRLFVQEQRVSALFSALINKVSPELRKWRDNNQNASVWVRNAQIEKLVDLRLNEFQSEFKKLVDTNVVSSWNASGDKNDKLVRDFIQDMALKQTIVDGLFNRNLEALDAFQKRVDNGFTLSDRIFQTAQNTKQQLEFYLKSGIGTGRSADQISRDIRQLLQDPDKRFRRVRNQSGKLIPSQPMKEFHPGQGVYRSAYKNAVRLAATETNMSYRLADAERWQQLDFVLGFEVKRSRNAAPCVICDALIGKYPKTFIFPGWHPFCICVATPILMTQENSAKYFLAKYSKKYGAKYKDSTPEYITEIPKNAQTFFENNKNFTDNFIKRTQQSIISGKPNNSIQKQKTSEIPEKQAAKVLSDLDKNILQVEQRLGIKKGIEMSFVDANELKGNVNHKKGGGYTINCQSCVVSNELRRRGFDVTALGNTGKKDSIPYLLSRKTEMAWIDPATNKIPIKQKAGGATGISSKGKIEYKPLRQLEMELSQLIKEPGRYNIDFGWKGTRSAHIITLEKLENGKMRLYDPQTGKIVFWAELSKKISLGHGVGVLRVDNLLVNTEIINGVVVKL